MQYDMLRAVCQLPCFISIVRLKKKRKSLKSVVYFFIEMQVDFLVSMFWLKNWEKHWVRKIQTTERSLTAEASP